jgi:hypothetical protein
LSFDNDLFDIVVGERTVFCCKAINSFFAIGADQPYAVFGVYLFAVGAINCNGLNLLVAEKITGKIILLHHGQHRFATALHKNLLRTIYNANAFCRAHPYEIAFVFCNTQHVIVGQIAIANS